MCRALAAVNLSDERRLKLCKEIEAVLSPEQRRQFRQSGPRWMEEVAE